MVYINDNHPLLCSCVDFSFVPVVWYLLHRTPIGLAARMAGENPIAVEVQGINVLSVRTGAIVQFGI